MKALLSILLAVALLPSLHAQVQARKAPAESPILVRIADDGAVMDKEFNPLEDDEAIKEFITKRKEEIEADGKQARLVLKGEKQILYKHGRGVIRMGSTVGVHRIVFSSITRPALINPKPHAEESDFVIAITADGRVAMNGDAMDDGPDDRLLQRLTQKLQLAVKMRPDDDEGPQIEVLADHHAKHPRVIDVLNAIGEAKVKSVVFDGPDAKE